MKEQAKRNPYLSDYKENAIEAEIKWYKAKEEERENEEISKKIWGF